MPYFIGRDDARVKSCAEIINALGGNPDSGMCCCPAHDDANASLHVQERNGKVAWHCFAGCSQQDVLDALRARGLWHGGHAEDTRTAAERKPCRSPAQKRVYASEIVSAAERLGRYARAQRTLPAYFKRRGIERVPPTALFALDALGRGPAMIFEVTDGTMFLGCHVTWLSPCKTRKRDVEKPRQFFAPIKGGYIKLYDGELDPSAKLVIAEGVETAMSAAQLGGGIAAIAALDAGNLHKITPPPATEYIIAADNDSNGAGQKGARALMVKLVRAGHIVRLAIPPRVDSDWNDVLLEGLRDG